MLPRTKDRIIDIYYDSLPCILCTADSYIASANDALRKKLSQDVEGELLYNSMKASDALLFDSLFEDGKGEREMSFDLRDFHGYFHACAFVGTVEEQRLAIVVLDTASKEDFCHPSVGCDLCKMTKDQRADSFADMVCKASGAGDGACSTIDLKRECAGLKDSLLRSKLFSNGSFSFSENRKFKSCDTAPVKLGQRCFLKLFLLSAFAALRLSANDKVDVRLCKYLRQYEIRFETQCSFFDSSRLSAQEIEGADLQAASALVACAKIAKNLICPIDISVKKEGNKLCLGFSFGEGEYDEVDFKSREALIGFESDFAFVERAICKMIYETQSSSASSSTVSSSP